MSLATPLPSHFRNALHDAGVSTELDFDPRYQLNANHPLLALSNSIHRELDPRRPTMPPRPTGLTRSPGIGRTGGDAAPPQATLAHSPTREQTRGTPLEMLRRADIDPHAFSTAVSNLVTFGNDLPPYIRAFLRNAGIPYHISRTEAFNGNHPLLSFDRQVRTALGARTPPAGTRSRPAETRLAGQPATQRQTTPTALDSADFDQSAVFAAPRPNVEGR
ncbi:hypothetical protein EPN42_15975 [bacterium]|nr:MAG: hypothetical protein EPN42_15975 [bacterium]